MVAFRDPLLPVPYARPLSVAGGARPAGGRRASLRFGRFWRVFAVVIAAALLFRTFGYEAFNIPSGSMMPTLLPGDTVLVSKFAFGFRRPALPFWHGGAGGTLPSRGDVVVFTLPREPETDYIKRVVGLPGDRIQMIDGALYLDGTPVPEERVGDFVEPVTGADRRVPQMVETLPGVAVHPLLKQKEHGALDDTPAWIVPAGTVFVMGDNRDLSEDSRAMDEVGFIPLENLVGRAEFRLFSLSDRVPWWQVWNWPSALRADRVLTRVK